MDHKKVTLESILVKSLSIFVFLVCQKEYKQHTASALHMHECAENPDGYLDANPQWKSEVSDRLTHDIGSSAG